LAGDDSLVVDLSSGTTFPSGGIVIDGGFESTSTGDRLTVQGGTFTTLTYAATALGRRGVDFSRGHRSADNLGSRIEPITVTSPAANVVLDIDNGSLDATASAITATLLDATGANMQVDYDVALFGSHVRHADRFAIDHWRPERRRCRRYRFVRCRLAFPRRRCRSTGKEARTRSASTRR
jgi:hypothetical protein